MAFDLRRMEQQQQLYLASQPLPVAVLVARCQCASITATHRDRISYGMAIKSALQLSPDAILTEEDWGNLMFALLRFRCWPLCSVCLQLALSQAHTETTHTILPPLQSLQDTQERNLLMYLVRFAVNDNDSYDFSAATGEHALIKQIFQQLCQLGCSVDQVAQGGWTLLHAALAGCNLTLVRYCCQQRRLAPTRWQPVAYTQALQQLHLISQLTLPAALDAPVSVVTLAIISSGRRVARLWQQQHEQRHDATLTTPDALLAYHQTYNKFKIQLARIAAQLLEILQLLQAGLETSSATLSRTEKVLLVIWLRIVIWCIDDLQMHLVPQDSSSMPFLQLSSQPPSPEQANFTQTLTALLQLAGLEATPHPSHVPTLVTQLVAAWDRLWQDPITAHTLFFTLIQAGAVELLQLLTQLQLQAMTNFFTIHSKHRIGLWLASIAKGDTALAVWLLQYGWVNAADQLEGYNGFMIAAATGTVSIIRYYLELALAQPAAPDFIDQVLCACDSHQHNACMLAALYDQAVVFDELINMMNI